MKKKMKAVIVNAQWKPRLGYSLTEREKRDKRANLGSKIYYRPQIKLQEIPIPEPADDEVLLKVGGCAVCGSDTAFLGEDREGYSRYSGHCRFPCVIGHEFSGEVVAIGKKVKNITTGTLVVAETMNWCGECMACRRGLFNQCENLEETGFTRNGAYAEYLTIKEKYCYSVDGFINLYGSRKRALEAAAMIEPLAVAYNGLFVRGGGFLPGGHVVIFGGGPIGLSTVALAKAAGAARIIVFELREKRQKLALKVGATDILNPVELKENGVRLSDRIMEITGGAGAAMVVEASGRQKDNIPEAADMLMPGGKIVQLGITSDEVAFLPVYLQKQGVDIRYSIGSSGHGIWPNVIRLIENGRLDPTMYLEKTYHIEEAIEAIESMKKDSGGKYVVTPNW